MPVWANTTTYVSTPSASFQNDGFNPTLPLPYAFLNWILNKLDTLYETVFQAEHDISTGAHTDVTMDTLTFNTGIDVSDILFTDIQTRTVVIAATTGAIDSSTTADLTDRAYARIQNGEILDVDITDRVRAWYNTGVLTQVQFYLKRSAVIDANAELDIVLQYYDLVLGVWVTDASVTVNAASIGTSVSLVVAASISPSGAPRLLSDEAAWRVVVSGDDGGGSWVTGNIDVHALSVEVDFDSLST